jgi:dynein heavy chain 2
VYRPIANSGSAIFFLIDSLRAVNHMYRFSLPAFLHLFTQNLRRPREGQLKTDALIQLLTRDLTTAVFGYVSRSLFKADRLMFAMHFAHQLRADLFGEHEWEFLLGELVDTHIDSSSGAAALPSWAAPDRASLFKSFATHNPQLGVEF